MNIQLQLCTTQEAQNLNMGKRLTDLVQSFWVEKLGSNFKNFNTNSLYTKLLAAVY